VDVEPGLGEQVRVPPLPARAVEHAGPRRELEHVDEPRDLAPVLLEPEDGLVLEQVARVEVRPPPVPGGSLTLRRGQKNTGSRYAPNTSSMAARISYSVQ
jgi:hypothetical protein